MNNKNNNLNIFLVFIIFLTSFLLGFLTNYKIQDNSLFTKEKNIDEIILDKIGDKFLLKDLDINLFWQIYNLVNNNFYSYENIDKQESVYGIVNGYVESLGDKHTQFFPPKEASDFNNTLSGDFEGIGAVIKKHELGILVDTLIKGSPALEGGIFKGDIIIEANGKELYELTLSEAVNYIKGPSGSIVELKIYREGEDDFLIKNIKRQKIQIPSVETKIFEENNIGYISLNMFGEKTYSEFLKGLEELENKNVDGLILDLRDNGGGLLHSAVEILSQFVENGKLLVSTKYKNNDLNESFNSRNNGKIFNKKIVVLINGNSASASEIVAGVLTDYKKAILVGEKTYGKGSVQQPFNLKDGSMLKLTIAKWYTPNDNSIDLNGINPDIEVEILKEDIKFDKNNNIDLYDRQLETAKEVLNNFIKLGNIGLVKEIYKNKKINENSLDNLDNIE
ncbi:MAG: S41 family peptidase, partial [Candidatus Gracilibacteria bacterium]|nr:S41 family peptidase [Candidatus Gracilibacteria bacterium]